jgi:hypothetical protein
VNFECAASGSGTPTNNTNDAIPNGWFLVPTDDVSKSDVAVDSLSNSSQGPQGTSTYYVGFFSTSTTSNDCLYATFATPGASLSNPIQYTVSFWVAVTGDVGANAVLIPEWDWQVSVFDGSTQTNVSLQAEMNSGTVDNPQSIALPTTIGPAGYEEFTFTETASSSVSNVMFHGGGLNAGTGILLDNVVVTEGSPAPDVPEPSTVLLTAAVVGAYGVRLVKKKSPTV